MSEKYTYNGVEYTPQETAIIENLRNPETLKVLHKVFCPDRNKIRSELEKNIAALSNEQYGEAMKVLFASELHFQTAMQALLLIGKKPTGNPGAVAPQ